MISTCKCPICHRETLITSVYEESIGVCESYSSCSTCNYYEEFMYGNYLEIVGNKYFTWDYKINYPVSLNPEWKKIKRAEFMARRNWKKFHKKTNRSVCPY